MVMKLNRIVLLILVLIFSTSCKSKNERQIEVITMNQTRPINELKKLVLTKGDTLAYDELEIAFLHEKYREEYLIYSIIMADKYNYPRAYFQVYHCLTSAFENHNGVIDEATKKMALNYLQKGVDLGECQSTKKLGELYMTGKYVLKDTVLGKKLEEKSRKVCGF
jgi:TPR repeat protein